VSRGTRRCANLNWGRLNFEFNLLSLINIKQLLKLKARVMHNLMRKKNQWLAVVKLSQNLYISAVGFFEIGKRANEKFFC
jgi:hypothetical protein